MKLTIDRAGRVVLPKDIRERAGLRPGAELHVFMEGERVVLEPAPMQAKLRRQGRLQVIDPLQESEKLTVDRVRDVLDVVREGHD